MDRQRIYINDMGNLYQLKRDLYTGEKVITQFLHQCKEGLYYWDSGEGFNRILVYTEKQIRDHYERYNRQVNPNQIIMFDNTDK